MEELLRDIRHGARMLASSPGFTIIAILALALGIGANTAIFTVVNAVLLRPLPFEEPDRLVQIWGSDPTRGVPFHNVFHSDACEWRKQSRSFQAMSACTSGPMNLVQGDQPERLDTWRVNANFLPMLGVKLLRGRSFSPEEDRPGAPPVVVMTHPLWQRRFGSDPGILGKTINLDGTPYTVIGILPADFEFTGRTIDLFTPLAGTEARGGPTDITVTVFARLKPGVSLDQSQTEMTTVGRRLQQFRGSLGVTPRVWGLRDFVVRDVKQSLFVLMAAVGLVLLIACANVANLLLARAGMRQRELALRTALGASRARIVRQLLTESAMLGLAGGLAGILLAYAGVRSLLTIIPGRYPLLSEASIDGRVLAFTLLVSLATGIIFGLAPALASSRSRALHDALKEGGRGSGESISRARLRSTLVVSEVALALVLLIGAGLMIRSFVELTKINPGFNPKGVLTANVNLPRSRYSKPGQRVEFFRKLFAELRSLPGVQAAGATTSLPLTQHNSGTGFIAEGRPIPPPEQIPIVWFRIVNSDYFRAMEVPLIRGRLFQEQDQTGPPAALVNETAARRFWPGEDAVGKRFTTGIPRPGTPVSWITVVGVVGGLRHMELHNPPEAEVFWPYQQLAPGSVSVAVRTNSDPEGFASQLRKAVAAIDKDQPISRIRGMEEIVARSIAPQRLSVLLLGIFAGLALTLAAVGIYGVISFSVTRRTREIGVRMTLGARARDVVAMVVGQALLLALVGVAIGLAAAFVVTRLMGSLLFGVSATDPAILAGVSVLLVVVAALASYLPARRAAAVDPLEALRYE
ncbi:MAG: ABC transporter permease [Acidobacteria bacterium]|nr:MAG: ABC transporter permease [Acidobacteriota bacterium]